MTCLLLILQQNDCYPQLLTKFVSQRQWVSQGTDGSVQLLNHKASWSCVGSEPKGFEVPAIFSPIWYNYSISLGQINEN